MPTASWCSPSNPQSHRKSAKASFQSSTPPWKPAAEWPRSVLNENLLWFACSSFTRAWELGTWTPSSWEAEESWWVRLGHWRQCTEKGLVPCHSNAGLGTECATMRVSCCKTNLVLSVFFLPCDRCLPPLHALLAALARAPAVWCHVTVSKTVN